MNSGGPARPIAGKDFPWEQISGYYLRLDSLLPFAKVDGDDVGPAVLDVYGLATVELPNPDVRPEKRLISLPVEHKSDFKSLFRATLDSGVRDKTNELIVLYENRRGFLGGKRACLHVAAYPTGTWNSFFDAVSRYAAQDFQWPIALFLYQPTSTQVFSARNNLFTP
jgi:hypothetical protein